MAAKQQIDLLWVDVPTNKYRFYRMTENDDNTFTAEYSRYGYETKSHDYPMSKWATKLREKLRKGYKKIGGTETRKGNIVYPDSPVTPFLQFLVARNTRKVLDTYSIPVAGIPQEQISKAKKLIEELSEAKTLKEAQDLHGRIFAVIPRKVPLGTKVKDHLVQSLEELPGVIDTEQDTLDTLKSQAALSNAQKDSSTVSILDHLGITLAMPDANDKRRVMQWANSFERGYHVKQLYKVIHHSTLERFRAYKPLTHNVIYGGHESDAYNWLSILGNGLSCRHANTSGNFGGGIYFSTDPRKCWGYGDSNHIMGLFEVQIGEPRILTRNKRVSIQTLGNYDSVAYKANRPYNEHIVYTDNQATIRYIVQLR